MQSILPWIGIVILFLTGWAVVKKYQVNMGCCWAVWRSTSLRSQGG